MLDFINTYIANNDKKIITNNNNKTLNYSKYFTPIDIKGL